MKAELRKILQDLFSSGVAWIPAGKSEKWIDMSVDEAEFAILELFNKQLPTERKEGFDDKNWSEQYGEMGGWNDCLADIKSRIEG